MTRVLTAHCVVLLAMALGCEHPEPPPAATPAPSAPAPAASVASEAPPAKAKAKINGKSLSEAEQPDVIAAIQKHDFAYGGGSDMTMGAMRTISAKGERKGVKAQVTLIRPSGDAETGGGMRMSKAKEQVPRFEKIGATYLEGEALLAVVVDGDKAQAKKILDSLLEL